MGLNTTDPKAHFLRAKETNRNACEFLKELSEATKSEDEANRINRKLVEAIDEAEKVVGHDKFMEIHHRQIDARMKELSK